MSGRPISASGPSIGNLVTDIFTIDKHPVTDIFTMKTTIVTMSVTGCVYREDVVPFLGRYSNSTPGFPYWSPNRHDILPIMFRSARSTADIGMISA